MAAPNKGIRIFWGLLIGSAIGLLLRPVAQEPWVDALLRNFVDPLGQLFLRGLILMVVPLVFSSLTVGVAQLGSLEHVRRLGWRLMVFYITTTLLGIFAGQAWVFAVQPGGLDVPLDASALDMGDQVKSLVAQSSQGVSVWPGILEALVPRNPIEAMAQGNMLAVIVLAIGLGIALATLGENKTRSVREVLESVSEAVILGVGWIMRIAPYAVAALAISAVVRLGGAMMGRVVLYMVVVALGFATQLLVVYPLILKWFIGYSPREFYRRVLNVQATAFSTSSSNATMPTTLYTLETRFRIPERITSFGIPLGATINMDGTALFETVAAVFLAQLFGVELGMAEHLTLVILILAGSVGVAGVPGGSIPILISALASVGIPPEGIAVIIGVDRLLDMARTVVNVTGDMVGTLYLARLERVPIAPEEPYGSVT